MGGMYGCGCKELYIYMSCICPFLQLHPYFLFIKKKLYMNKNRDAAAKKS